MLDEQLRRALDRRRQNGILRDLKPFTTTQDAALAGPVPIAAPKGSSVCTARPPPLIDFSSNDYLGMARGTDMRQRFLKKMHDSARYPLGSTGSRLLDGNSIEHEELEHRLAQHFCSSSALLFNSGYDANTSLLSVLPQPGDYILYDELAHASMHDGMRASRIDSTRRIPFAHNDLNDVSAKLDSILDQASGKEVNIFVAVEAVYSMDGDTCPLRELAAVLDSRVARTRRCLIVDEAHSVGLYGLNGAGLCEALGVRDLVDIRLATFGKAFGCSGAAVLCQPIVRLYLINYARPLIYSTALPHPSLIAIHAALDILSTPTGALRAAQTFSLTQKFIDRLYEIISAARGAGITIAMPADVLSRVQGQDSRDKRHSFVTAIPPPPIVPILTAKARSLAHFLTSRGFLVRPIAYPTVAQGLERVRICIHAHNSYDEVIALLSCVESWIHLQAQQDEGQQTDLASPADSQAIQQSVTSIIEKAKL